MPDSPITSAAVDDGLRWRRLARSIAGAAKAGVQTCGIMRVSLWVVTALGMQGRTRWTQAI